MQRPRLVIDTNVFVAAAYHARSASRQICEQVAAGELRLLISRDVFREYRFILSRAIQLRKRQSLVRSWLAAAEPVDPAEILSDSSGIRYVPDDPEDDKFVRLAIAGRATAIVSSDSHLHALPSDFGVRVWRPTAAIAHLGFAEPVFLSRKRR